MYVEPTTYKLFGDLLTSYKKRMMWCGNQYVTRSYKDKATHTTHIYLEQWEHFIKKYLQIFSVGRTDFPISPTLTILGHPNLHMNVEHFLLRQCHTTFKSGVATSLLLPYSLLNLRKPLCSSDFMPEVKVAIPKFGWRGVEFSCCLQYPRNVIVNPPVFGLWVYVE